MRLSILGYANIGLFYNATSLTRGVSNSVVLRPKVIVLERANRMIYNVDELRKDYRLKLYLM